MALLSILLVLHLVLRSYCTTDEKKDELPGHMRPLGSHMPPEYVKRVTELATPTQFVDQNLHPKQPVVFEGVIKDLDVRKNWANDDYLRSVEVIALSKYI